MNSVEYYDELPPGVICSEEEKFKLSTEQRATTLHPAQKRLKEKETEMAELRKNAITRTAEKVGPRQHCQC